MSAVKAVNGTGAGSNEHLRELRLTPPEMKMLAFVAERGGEIEWDWSKVNPNAKAMVANMINSGLVIDREHVDRGVVARVTLRLTDRGRAVAAALEAMQVKPN